MDRSKKNSRTAPDFGPLPADADGLVLMPKIRGFLGGRSEQTVRNWIALNLLPPLVRVGPNTVGMRAGELRRASAELPTKMAALKRPARATGARAKVEQAA